MILDSLFHFLDRVERFAGAASSFLGAAFRFAGVFAAAFFFGSGSGSSSTCSDSDSLRCLLVLRGEIAGGTARPSSSAALFEDFGAFGGLPR